MRFAVELELRAGELVEEHAVSLGDEERPDASVVQHPAGAGRDDLALLRLLPGGSRDQDSARGGRLFGEPLDHESVVERPDHRAAFWAGCGQTPRMIQMLRMVPPTRAPSE